VRSMVQRRRTRNFPMIDHPVDATRDLRIPTNATTHSNGSRPGIPIDRDQCGAGADSAVG